MEKEAQNSLFLDKKLQSSFDLNGYVVIQLLNKEEIDSLSSNLEKELKQTPEGFYSTSFNEDEALKERLNLEIERIVASKTQSIVNKHQKLGSCYLVKTPGEKGEMPLHQDWTVVDEEHFDSLTIWIPLQNVDKQNGAMQVIPGSHRFSKKLRSPLFDNPLREIEEELRADLIDVELKAGEAIIFSQALIHASPPNLSSSNRVAVTYGLIAEEAQLLFYYKNQEGKGEKYSVPIDFFKTYNTQIGAKPELGTCLRTFTLDETPISKFEYKLAKGHYNMNKNKAVQMIPIFKNSEHQTFFEKEGYLVLPLLSSEEVEELTQFYASLQLKDEQGYGFHVSMDGLNTEQSVKVREKLWGIILPKLNTYLENFKPFVASYVVKETNPKGVVPAHQDWSFVADEEKGFSSITCWTALVDTELDNGCMGVIKGSHKLMQNHRPSPSPQTPVPLSEHMFSIFPYLTTLEMKAGEVLFFDNRTFHASPPNTMEGIRLAAGVGVTQKEATLIHYHLKPDGNKNVIQKYAIDEDFFLKYNNSRLAKMYDAGEAITDYKLIEEIPYTYDQYTSEELVAMIKECGNEFNVPMCEKLSVLFGYDMSGKKKEEPEVKEEKNEVVETPEEEKKSFFEVYTPINIIKEIKFRITGK